MPGSIIQYLSSLPLQALARQNEEGVRSWCIQGTTPPRLWLTLARKGGPMLNVPPFCDRSHGKFECRIAESGQEHELAWFLTVFSAQQPDCRLCLGVLPREGLLPQTFKHPANPENYPTGIDPDTAPLTDPTTPEHQGTRAPEDHHCSNARRSRGESSAADGITMHLLTSACAPPVAAGT